MHKKLNLILQEHIYFSHACEHHKYCEDAFLSENEEEADIHFVEPKMKRQKHEDLVQKNVDV